MSGKNKHLSISVIIPNYNGRHLLENNLPYLVSALNRSGCLYEIIIPDDASTDDSVPFLQKNYPDIICIPGTHNGGFSKNINRGIARASMKLVMLLNSDIIPDEDYFEHVLPYFNHQDTFGVMGTIMQANSNHIAEACKFPSASVFKINSFKDVPFDSANRDIYTLYLSGANALVERKKLIALGSFNELFSPFYQEDLDLSLRAWECGWKCYYEDQAVCHHLVSATIKKHSTRKYIKIISTRNKLQLHYLHLDGFRLYAWAGILVASLTIRWALGHFFYYKATGLFIKNFKQIKKYKRDFRQTAKEQFQFIPFTAIKKSIMQQLHNKPVNNG
ncbi:glycosyltransferase (plasmid) [Pedobacter sp. BS3]|uniref:glycosyltransferase family 2 protein n=1 Tax=Pedobacter sp. BS3 TaxID=2567937 RepID=UPI0011EEC593|nr:glycosyltransferase [Pedobacter sp. BS3]TZF86017.1 glycosyltransferase [Pedobacter sp. BS3]